MTAFRTRENPSKDFPFDPALPKAVGENSRAVRGDTQGARHSCVVSQWENTPEIDTGRARETGNALSSKLGEL